ncbi:Hsp20/alpha crystallin family protein [Candidatus Woesearchaeota archaeon]|jgi:HSP20 family protein|nr:Hsp20/alpha crystallin family protein [Candidatus Woesearchaeota archaeon]
MTKVAFRTGIPYIDRDDFLTPFDKMFDSLVETQFPDMVKSVGVKPYQGSAYPKVNVYEYDDRVGIIAEIPGLDKNQLDVSVEDGVLTISGDKHSAFEDDGANVIRRELKQSSFKRSFELGELLDGDDISAKFKDGILSVSIPKIEPEIPKKHSVKIG